ncbi:molybdate ABC transporter substrate-binding protein [Blastochloris sulfoviridis]|uniref:molybdate ABC transporter substrate-binding protein n=1 Tax=Blastochloris sulfoviridis TaxID=50712 RepID=UPI001478689C|nr:molybdate ABC transporter substrate-binding protein [Blastochloris sulfoviridis]
MNDGVQERPQERPADRPLSVLAADALRPTLDDIVGLYTAASGLRVMVTYGASDALAETLDQGAAADLFISDVRAAMDLAVDRRLVKAESRRSLASNRLVLVAPKDSSLIEVLLGPGTRLSTLAGQGRIAVGAAEAMPGAVVRTALESLGLWADAEPCLTAAETSRAAVAMVGRGEAPLGIVFVSDSRFDPAVKVVGIFPETSHRPIVYEGALTATAGISAPALLDFLQSAAARAAFEKAGYLTLK